jgi:hypothetical protein
MTHWKWINDNGDIYLQSKVATVIIHDYRPHEWDIESFEQHSDIIPLIPFDDDLILLSAWRFFALHELLS